MGVVLASTTTPGSGDGDVLAVVAAAVVTIVVAAQLQVVAARALLGEDGGAAPRGGVLREVLARVDRTGTLIVPGLLALAAGAAIGWPARVPVPTHRLAPARRLLVAAVAPTTAALVAGLAVLSRELGWVAGESVGSPDVVATTAVLLAVFWALPAPPLPGGAVVAVLLRDDAARRWGRWARAAVAPYGFVVGALLVLTDVDQLVQRLVAG